jgi:hypothetical protein
MRKTALAAAALAASLCVIAASASAAPVTQLAQGYDYGVRYYSPYYDGYRPPACPYRYHWECWIDPYGRQGCGCRPDFGLYPGLY